mgnify:FL=1
MELAPVEQPGGKVIHSWAIEQDLDEASLESNLFVMEWPPRSGRRQEFPEVDRASWFAWPLALRKVSKGQRPILIQVLSNLGVEGASIATELSEFEAAEGTPDRRA